MNYSSINEKISDINRVANREERRMLQSLKNDIFCYNNKMHYLCYYDKRLSLPNYNMLMDDVSDLHKESFYLVFIRIPGLNINCHLDNEEDKNQREFLRSLKNMIPDLDLLRNNIYIVSDYIALIAGKGEVNDAYKLIKKLKKSNENYKNYQMTYIKYEKTSSKVAKNINACIKRANDIFTSPER